MIMPENHTLYTYTLMKGNDTTNQNTSIKISFYKVNTTLDQLFQ